MSIRSKALSAARLITLMTALMLSLSALAEPLVPGGPYGGAVTGPFDEPAPDHPEARYDDAGTAWSASDADALYFMLDAQNDEASDIETYGALYVEEQHVQEGYVMRMAMQDCPYGRVVIMNVEASMIPPITMYAIGPYLFGHDGQTVERAESFFDDYFEDYGQHYHFPYSPLKALRGIRQDENGYTYFYIESDEPETMEFVTGEDMRIHQLRIYMKDSAGTPRLYSLVNYSTGPAWEIPDIVLDTIGGYMDETGDEFAAF